MFEQYASLGALVAANVVVHLGWRALPAHLMERHCTARGRFVGARAALAALSTVSHALSTRREPRAASISAAAVRGLPPTSAGIRGGRRVRRARARAWRRRRARGAAVGAADAPPRPGRAGARRVGRGVWRRRGPRAARARGRDRAARARRGDPAWPAGPTSRRRQPARPGRAPYDPAAVPRRRRRGRRRGARRRPGRRRALELANTRTPRKRGHRRPSEIGDLNVHCSSSVLTTTRGAERRRRRRPPRRA